MPLLETPIQVERPDAAMVWLVRPKLVELLTALGHEDRTLTRRPASRQGRGVRTGSVVAVIGHHRHRTAGAVTVLVSHRFSTVSMADHVLVIADGGIAESGSHQDLLESGGRYAQLYATQAQAYAAGSSRRWCRA